MKEMKERIIEVKDYLTKSNLPASDFVINPYAGGPHGCKYCYACFMKCVTKHDEEWGTFIDIKRCAKLVSSKRLEGKKVFRSSMTSSACHIAVLSLVRFFECFSHRNVPRCLRRGRHNPCMTMSSSPVKDMKVVTALLMYQARLEHLKQVAASN